MALKDGELSMFLLINPVILEKLYLNVIKTDRMKEYKVIKKGFWKKDHDFEDILNQYAREGWKVSSALGNGHGDFSKVILERDKNRM